MFDTLDMRHIMVTICFVAILCWRMYLRLVQYIWVMVISNPGLNPKISILFPTSYLYSISIIILLFCSTKASFYEYLCVKF